MKTELITIGNEILLGQILDSNAAWIAKRLPSVGANLIRKTTIGDADEEIIAAVNDALERSELVITTGGLGPTEDDLTKYALAKAFGREMKFHQEILDLVMERYGRRGYEIPEMVKTQAEQPEGATLFHNPIGSAFGIMLEKNNRRVISLPGVPAEMKAIMEQSVLPYLSQLEQANSVLYKNILTFGTFESHISDLLDEHGFSHEGCELAFLPSVKGVILRLTYRGEDKEHGQRLLDEQSSRLEEIVAEYYVCDDDRDLVTFTADLLKEKKMTVSTAESCTGGMISSAFTDLPGSSEFFIEGVVTYSNRAKTDLLDVPQECLLQYGAVSEQTVYHMANNMRQKAGTDFALAVSGIAGPGGGSGEKPVGLIYISLAHPGGVEVHRQMFGQDRHMNRQRSVYFAVNYLRLKLLEH